MSMTYSKRSAMIVAGVILNFILSANNRGTMATFICPLNYNSCYKLLPDKLKWPAAKAACEDNSTHPAGSYLFVPSSSEEEAFINGYYSTDLLIGCKPESVDQFECYHENEELQYTNWNGVYQPDGELEADKVFGVYMRKDGNGWDQTKDAKDVLCELPKVEVKPITRTCRSGTYVAYPSTNQCMSTTMDAAVLQVIESLKNVKRCGAACMKDLRCYSFNFIKNSEQDERGRCELFAVETGYMMEKQRCRHYTLE